MRPYHYQNNHLFIEHVAIAELAEQVGTPFYCYSQAKIEQQYRAYADHLHTLDSLICYALKANSNQAVIKLLANLGAGADVVSEGELRRALQAGVPANKIVFAGVAKTRSEIEFALKAGILQFNVESINELQLINSVAQALNLTAPVAIRINPDVDAVTHAKITTGKTENKFGIPIMDARDIYRQASGMPGIRIQGVAMHIGSQLIHMQPYQKAFSLLLSLVTELRAEGHPISVLDLGGGLGISYHEGDSSLAISDYCGSLNELLKEWDGRVILEPGRSLVAESGLLVSKVIYMKEGHERTFCILDSAMNDLIRPSMYDVTHELIAEQPSTEQATYDLVGPVCETGDTFARNYRMSKLAEGDLVAFSCAGAYGAVMASTYNSRLLVPEVLISGNNHHVIRARQSYQGLISADDIPGWM
jgi:diaminopimelate decarboxylase